MAAGTYNIQIEQYASFSEVWTLRINGALVDLTGYSANLNIQAVGGALIAALSSAAGTLVLGGAAGTITPTLTPNQADLMPPGQYAYDLLLTSPAGVKTRLLEGGVNVVAGVTPS